MPETEILLASKRFSDSETQKAFSRIAEDFVLHQAETPEAVNEILRSRGPRIEGAIVSALIGLNRDQIAAMPGLRFVQMRGRGYETVDIEALRKRKIVLAQTRDTNGFSVAEHGVAILLTLLRDVIGADRDIRAGRYVESQLAPPRTLLFGKRVGVLGLGDIGLGFVRRLTGFEVQISYHNRKPRSDVPYHYFESPGLLAQNSDILFVALPGGESTRGIVDREILGRLGSSGYLVNVGRGSTVDNQALADALESGAIAGAALDVVDGEPEIPASFLRAPNLILTPHVGASSPEARIAGIRFLHENLRAFFCGEDVTGRLL